MADSGGIASVSMRNLARQLGVEAMSLYNHVSNKDDLRDGMIDRVFGEIELSGEGDWRLAMRERAIATRRVLLKHPWSIGLLDSRGAPGPALLRHHDRVIELLRTAGFSLSLTAHAFAVLDSFIYGFVLQEAGLPSGADGEMDDAARHMLDAMPTEEYPHLAELTREHVLRPGYEFANSFEVGLDLILDGLDRYRMDGASGPRSHCSDS